MSSRSSASITISARKRCRTSCSSASPTHCSSRCGIASTSRTCRSRWRNRSASRAAASSMRRAGVIRDVIQNHLLQVLSLLAMEAPIERRAPNRFATSRPRCCATFGRSIPTISCSDNSAVIATKNGVAQDSTVPTYAALRLHIDSWRWEGVPFFVRAGKKLARSAPRKCRSNSSRRRRWCFDDLPPAIGNYVRFRLGPEVAIGIGAAIKKPGERLAGKARRSYPSSARTPPTTWMRYERLLGDAMHGDATLFARQDSRRSGVEDCRSPDRAHRLQGDRVRARRVGPEGSGSRSAEGIGGWNLHEADLRESFQERTATCFTRKLPAFDDHLAARQDGFGHARHLTVLHTGCNPPSCDASSPRASSSFPDRR